MQTVGWAFGQATGSGRLAYWVGRGQALVLRWVSFWVGLESWCKITLVSLSSVCIRLPLGVAFLAVYSLSVIGPWDFDASLPIL